MDPEGTAGRTVKVRAEANHSQASTNGNSARRDDHLDAARIAAEAGRVLLELRGGLVEGMSADAVRKAGDQRSHELITNRLRQMHPDDAVLSEEGRSNPARPTASRVWIVDPLDGTREFGEPDRSDWAVHVALVVGARPVAGAVALPARGLTLATRPAPALSPRRSGPPRMAVSRTRPPQIAGDVANELGADLVEMGSAGAKAMAVVLGDADIYLHAGGQYVWDSAAPVAVAGATGVHVSRLDGSVPLYDPAAPWLPDLIVCRPELAKRVMEAVARHIPSGREADDESMRRL
jgi:3'(2'), 5'-bisphosphate nucleotidase